MTPICADCGLPLTKSEDDSGAYYCENCGYRTDDGFWEAFESFVERFERLKNKSLLRSKIQNDER